MSKTVPFVGVPPEVVRGQAVQCRTASGDWALMVAGGPARYDREHAAGRFVRLTVPVTTPQEWEATGPEPRWINWPAGDVVGDPEEIIDVTAAEEFL